MGLAIPNFLLALVFMYVADNWFATSIGNLMDAQYLNAPHELGKDEIHSRTHLDTGHYRWHSSYSENDPPPSCQSIG